MKKNDSIHIANYCISFIDLLGQRSEYKNEGILPKFETPEDKAKFIERIKHTIAPIDDLQRSSSQFLESSLGYSVTTDQRTSQNHRLQPSQSDQRAHLCVLCCFKKHTNPFRAFKKKIGGGIDHQIASLMVNLSNFILRTLFQGRRMVALFF